MDKVKEIVDHLLNFLPEYKTLKDAKTEMERKNTAGYDNYAHRLGMCRIGQMGAKGNILSPRIGEVLGWGKEAYDIYNKSVKGSLPWGETLYDSFKDLNNNYEGLNQGLKYPDEDCRIWLKDLDFRKNEWKK